MGRPGGNQISISNAYLSGEFETEAMRKVRRQTRPSDGPHLVLALVLLIFVVAASLSDGRLLPDFASSSKPGQTVSGDDRLVTGSILIAPPEGNVCEHRLIDNRSWHIRPAGFVACDEAVSWTAQQRNGASAVTRIEAIREGFHPKR